MTKADEAELIHRGQIRHEQMVEAGKELHAFTPHAWDNRCDKCGLDRLDTPHGGGDQLLLKEDRET